MARVRNSTPTLFDLEPPAPAPVVRPGCFARVALNRPVPREFTYAVPAGLQARVHHRHLREVVRVLRREQRREEGEEDDQQQHRERAGGDRVLEELACQTTRRGFYL